MSEKIYIKTEIGENGEILKSCERRVKYFDVDSGYLFWLNKEAIKVFKGCGLPENLTECETARVYRLSLTAHKGSNLISYRSGNVIKGMSIDKISEYLGITSRQAAAFVNKMIYNRIIGKVKVRIGRNVETQYYINPIYFFNGKWLSYNLYFLFKRDLDGILPEWVKNKFNQDFTTKSQV